MEMNSIPGVNHESENEYLPLQYLENGIDLNQSD